MVFRYSEKRLANDIGRIAKTIDSTIASTYLPETHEVRFTSQDVGDPAAGKTLALGNLFARISALPRAERGPAIEGFLDELLNPRELSPDELLNSLALRVRTDFEVSFRNRHLKLQGKDALDPIWFRRGELVLEVVSDSNDAVATPPREELLAAGLTEDEAIRIASANLRRQTTPDQWQKLENGIWMSTYQDDYDFARLIAAERSVRYPFDGPPIIFAPSHSVCLATDRTEDSVLSRLTDIGNEEAANDRPLCQFLWKPRDHGNWGQWKSEQSNIAALQLIRETAERYNETKEYLERAIDDDVFIASYMAIDTDEGLTSLCSYTIDLPSYLPLTDFVFIMDPERPVDDSIIGRLTWADFERTLGSDAIEKVEDMEPPWYRVTNPISPHQKERLKELASPVD